MHQQRHLRPHMPLWPLVLGAIFISAVATALTMWWQMRPVPVQSLFTAPTFEMTSQHGQAFSSDSLKGKVWVANFIFTNCAGPCPRMTEAMAAVSGQINSSRVRFVSISVDPKRDLPPVLKIYGNKYNADQTRWLFLTEPGTSYLDLAAGFKVAVKPADGSTPILHSALMFLVDPSGEIRGTYSHNDEQAMKQLVTDVGRLLNE